VAIAKLLADPLRLRIVWSLVHDEHAVHELADHVGANPAAVSQHLARLRAEGVVRRRREGNFLFYSCEDRAVAAVASALVGACSPDGRTP
jgi:DNA-binding transcriptional ArsR family regulator